jgi:tRNA pseudouridine55 synthase
MDTKKQQSGFLLIDKPSSWTSFDIVAKLRGITKVKKIGHAGTLDPLATGLLIVAIGKDATKHISKYMKLDKVYETTMILGKISTTYDADGEISEFRIKNLESRIKNLKTSHEELGTRNREQVSQKDLEETINKFKGKISQIPPMYSAKKVKGKKLYELARKGIEVERESINIEIFDISLLDFTYPKSTIRVYCSTGTYIRSLVHDIGQVLGVGAYVEELRRIKIGDFDVNSAHNIKDITAKNWLNLLREM